MNYKIKSCNKKPTNNIVDNQLFSFDVSFNGAKNFFFDTYNNIYDIIINNKSESNFYEDNTFSNKIKLFVDIDEHHIFDSQLERDKYANNFVSSIIMSINIKLYQTFKINNPKIIILMSDTLLKLSLHLIYPDIIFNNIYEMKYFMNDIQLIDQNPYKIGCFRMLYCSKIGKNNKLLFFRGIDYEKPNDDYLLFLDCCICYSQNNIKSVELIIPNIIKTKNERLIKLNNKKIEKKYIYKNINLLQIKRALNNLNFHSENYYQWLLIGFCLKDLYDNTYKKYQKYIFNLFDEFSKKSNKYNKQENKNIFLNLEPKIDINYLFKLADIKYYILPFYNYQKIIFDSKNHNNIMIRNEKFINISVDELLKNKYIFLKSPTGTGKTTFLKKILDELEIYNIISITSRVNLAGEHTKHLNLNFYMNLSYENFKYCDRLVIQLESLKKCNYQNFKNGIVILDEINSLLSHLRSPTLDKKRKEIYLYLIELIQNAKYIISLDADLSDWNINFLQEIQQNDYIVYYNTIKNKNNIKSLYYNCPQIMIDKMEKQIKENKYFISCFDSLKQMNKIIEYLSQFGNKDEWLIYSSEIDYGLINTKLWINKFIFFTPSIIYGIDYNYQFVDVFCFVYKNHLNSLQIYQMISRARKQNIVHVYCKENEYFVKYKSVNDVIEETELYEKNFSYLLTSYNNYIDIDDKPYRIMYYNYKFMDSILKTNTRNYLIDIMQNNGYVINFNNEIKGNELNKKEISNDQIKDRIVNLLCLDKSNLSIFEKDLVSNDKLLEKHFNLRIFLNYNIQNKLIESIEKNLFIETIKNKYTKINICKKLMNLLEISTLEDLSKNITNKFNDQITNEWLTENIKIIKKTFEIRAKKYDNFDYYNMYMLLITILKNLFDINLFIRKECQINKIKYVYYLFNNNILMNHVTIINQLNNYNDVLFLD